MQPIALPDLIKCTRIYLRPLKSEDAEVLFNLINKQRAYIAKHLDWVDNVQTLGDEINYVAKKIKERKDLKSFDWCIFKNDTNEFLGYIGTDPVNEDLLKRGESIDWHNATISFAYFLKQEANGFGYMTEALLELKKIATKLGFKRVEIITEPENIKSQAVGKRCGLVPDKRSPGKMYSEVSN